MKTRNPFFRFPFRTLTVILSVLLTTQFLSGQSGWYDAQWQHRTPVDISNPGSTSLSVFQVKITLTGGTGGNFDFSKAENDGSDIRFTAENGLTLIPFWIEEWNAGTSATFWVKVPSIPVEGSTIFMYYGNGSATITDPPYVPYFSLDTPVSPDRIETPPAGPYTKHPDNPIIPIGRPSTGATGLLAENVVYDEVTGHYWMVLSNQTIGSNICLVYSDDPTNPDAWYWPQVAGVPATPVINNAIAPHIMEHNGTWYIFYGDRARTSSNGSSGRPVSVATSSSVSGPYTYLQEALPAGMPGSWESFRVDEPYVFQRSDGKWIMMYMAETGLTDEQVGYATADNIQGPYTKFEGNPCLAFGPPGDIDAGTIADPWIYEFDRVYYIGYTVSPTIAGWSTALATTTDWQTFTKHGLILDRGTEGNSFRGAVTRIGDEYLFTYTAGSYNMAIATQPVFIDPASDPVNVYTDPEFPLATIDNPETVFDFYDGFDTGSDPDLSKWRFDSGNASQTSVSGGLLTMTASGTYVRLDGLSFFGMGYIGETFARDPVITSGIVEAGFVQGAFTNCIRITDNYPGSAYVPSNGQWQHYVQGAYANMAATLTTGWHLYSIYRESSGTAGFRIDDNAAEEVATGVPTADMSPFLMSYSSGNQFIVDWTRVRKWAGADPVIAFGTEESDDTRHWTGAAGNTDWHDAGNWDSGVPDAASNAFIPSVTYQPVISAPAFCNNITISNGATLAITGTNTLTSDGTLTNNGGTIAIGDGALSVRWDLTNNGGTLTLGAGTLTVTRNLNNNLGDFTLGTGTVTVNADWTYNGGALTPDMSTVILNGSTQTISGTTSSTFNNLTISSSVVTTLGINTIVAGNLNITAGVFDLGSFSCNRSTEGGVLMVAAGATLKIGGNNTTLPSGFNTHSFDATSITDYSGSAQTVAILAGSEAYGNLVLSGSGAKLFPGDITASGYLSFNEGVMASLATGTTSTAGSLFFDGIPAVAGSFGSLTSAAVNKNETYFTSWFDGILNHTAFEAGTWLGGINGYWHDAANWMGGIPTSLTDVIIPNFAGNQPEISPGSPPAICGDLTVSTGASLTISAGQSLTVSGDLSVSGTLTIESSTMVSNGSLIVTGNSSGNVTYNRLMNTSNNLYHYFAPPVGTSTFPTEGTVWTYDESAGTWVVTTASESGRGYTLEKGIEMLSFTGPLITSNTIIPATSPYADIIDGSEENYNGRHFAGESVEYPLGNSSAVRSLTNYGGGGWNLLGNPFTSAMNVEAFITDPDNSGQFDPNYVALYLFNGSSYRYVSNPIGSWLNGTALAETYIQAGQGFFVLAMNDYSEYTFKRSMQGHDTDVLLMKSTKTDDRWPGLELKVNFGVKESSTIVAYEESMTAGLDPGYDIGQLSSGPEVEIYTVLALKDNGVNFTRQALPVSGADKLSVPIGIDSEKGGEVTFAAVTVPLGTYKFWLEDRLMGIFTDLSMDTYKVTLPAKTYGTGRFFLKAGNSITDIDLPSEDPDGLNVRIWTSQKKVIIKGAVSERAIAVVYDLQGNKVAETLLTDVELNTIDMPAGSKGVFLVRIADGVKVTTKKVAIL